MIAGKIAGKEELTVSF